MSSCSDLIFVAEIEAPLLREKLASLGRHIGVDDLATWKLYLATVCEELDALRSNMEATAPRIVEDESNPGKSSVLNYLTLEHTVYVAQLFEVLVCWALRPVLSFEVPLESRSEEFLVLVKALPEHVAVWLSEDFEPAITALRTLYGCLAMRELGTLIVNGSLVDVVPALVRFGFEKTILNPADVQWCNTHFKLLISASPVPTSSMARLLLMHLSFKPRNQVAIRVLSSAIYMLLCERVDGVVGILAALLDSKSGVVNVDALNAAAKTISAPPERTQMNAYFEKVCPQLLAIIRAPRTQATDKYISCASEIFRVWSTTQPELTVRLWLVPAFSPFLPFLALYLHNTKRNANDKLDEYLDNSKTMQAQIELAPKPKIPKIQFIEEFSPSEDVYRNTASEERLKWWQLESITSWNSKSATGVIVNAKIVEITIFNAKLLLYSSGDSSFCAHFEPIVPTIVNILSICYGHSQLIGIEKEATSFLQRFFNLCAPKMAFDLLEYISMKSYLDWRGLEGVTDPKKEAIGYEISERENSQLVVQAVTVDADAIPYDAIHSSQQVISVLRVLDGEVSGLFFLKILEDLFSTLTISKALISEDPASVEVLAHLSMEERMTLLQAVSERQIKQMNVLLPLLENFGPSVLRNTVQICLFIKNMLELGGGYDEELQILGLTILKEILDLSLVESGAEADILLIDLLTPLKNLFDHPSSSFITEMSQYCYEKISSRNRANMEVDENEARKKELEEEQKEEEEEGKPKRRWVLEPKAKNVDEALEMISNPLVPIRAGGLIQLRRFILREDKTALAQVEKIFETFSRNLSNSDSYVYLGAIQGLSAIADVHFSLAMPKLIQQYRDGRQHSLEIRLNIGESILQVARRLDEALPKYASQFFDFLLPSAQRDPQALIRASSLSNIAELCEILRFALLPFIEEIMDMCYDILMAEKDMHVRRGCVHLLAQLFKGLQKDVFQVIPTHLKRISELLEAIEDSDKDEVMRAHAKRALDMYTEAVQLFFEKSADDAKANFLEPSGIYESLRIVKM